MLGEFMCFLVSYLVLIICVLVSVAFLTLLERKGLGYIQIRKGPNKVGLIGILQPFSDAVKLFSKEQTFPFMSNYIVYYFSPIMGLIIALSVWLVLPMISHFLSFKYGFMFFLCLSSLGVYSLMMSGWSSNSNYALLGSLRAVAQTISYEVSMILIILTVFMFIYSYNFVDFSSFQESSWFIFIFLPLFYMWFISCLAETNRTPFDFAEGESELVSGFNVEYSSGGFALIFLAEYGMILMMSMLISLFFLGGDYYSLLFFFKMTLMSFIYIWIRGALPRFRYDKLMSLAWKSFLPISLNFLIFACCLIMIM